MIFDILSWLGVACAAGAALFLFMIYLELRTSSNQLMAVSMKEFHESTQSLLTADVDELPDSVVSFLSIMIDRLEAPNSHWELLSMARLARKSLTDPDTGPGFRSSSSVSNGVKSLRPELLELFNKSSESWFRYLCYRNVFVSVLLAIEFQLMRGASGRLEQDAGGTALSLLRRMDQQPC